MKPEFTRWFSIDKDGNPARPGYYEVLFQSVQERPNSWFTRYWTGTSWQHYKEGTPSLFGVPPTPGERWRGLVAPLTQQEDDQ